MKTRKFFAAGMSFAVAASLLAGCASKDENASVSDQGQAPETTTTAAPEAQMKQEDIGAVSIIEADNSKPNPAKTRTGADNTLIIGMAEPKGDALPIYYSSKYDGYLTELMFEGLLSHDASGTKIPVIAEELPEISEDKKTYTFKIKQGIKFSDGTELKASDVKFTYTAICDPSYDGRYFYGLIDTIEGAEAYRNGEADEVTGIKVIDDYTISFTFKEALVTNIDNLTMGIMPEAHYKYEKGNTKALRDAMANYDFVGSGPYKMVKYEPKQYVEFTRNEHYSNGEPAKVENVITKVVTPETQFAELEKGTVDVVLQVPTKTENLEQGQEMGFIDIRQYPSNSYGFMVYNFDDPRLADKAVRQALTYGFDREKFNAIYYGPGNANVSNGPVSMVSWAYTDRFKEEMNPYKYDPAKAEELLDAAGWVKGADGIREKDGERLDFKWYTYTDSKYIDTLIPILKEDWAKIGVKVEPELMEFNTMTEKVFTQQDFTMANLAWSMTPDPDGSYGVFHSSGDVPDGNNGGSFRNEECDRLLDEGRAEFDQAKRAEIYTDWALLINEEQPYMFMNQGIESEFVNNRVKNFETSSYITFPQIIKNVELEK